MMRAHIALPAILLAAAIILGTALLLHKFPRQFTADLCVGCETTIHIPALLQPIGGWEDTAAKFAEPGRSAGTMLLAADNGDDEGEEEGEGEGEGEDEGGGWDRLWDAPTLG